MIRVAAILLLTGTCFALDPTQPLTELGRQTWQVESGLPSSTVHAVLQSREGFLWFGTDAGLVRFDGYAFRIFDTDNTPGLLSNRIRALAEDPEGGLWMATPLGAARLLGGKVQLFTSAEGLPSDDVVGVALRSGAPVIQTASGAVEYGNGRFSPTAPLPPVTGEVSFRDREGALWIGGDNGLERIYAGERERFPESDGLSSDAILAITEDREGDLWIGTGSSGVTVLRNQKFSTTLIPASDPASRLRCVMARGDRVWFGSDGAGVLEDPQLSPAPFNTGLSSKVVLSLAQTRSGDLLVGTPDGLNRIHSGGVTAITTADGLPDDFIRSIYVDADDSIWAGTRKGLAHLQNGAVAVYSESSGLGSSIAGSILRDRTGTLWVGTLHGLSRMREGRFTNYTIDDGLTSNVITSLALDEAGNLWIGTQGGGLNEFANDTFTAFPARTGAPDTILGLMHDKEGQLWMAAQRGIYRFANGRFVPYGALDGLRVQETAMGGHPVIAADASGDLWFAMQRGAVELPVANLFDPETDAPAVIESFTVDGRPYPATSNVPPGHEQFAFEYAVLDFRSPQRVRYRYKLENFDRNWIDAGNRRVAYYTNLPPGDFRFIVQAQSGGRDWNQQEAELRFRVRPHLYQTWWVRGLVVAALAGLIYLFYLLRLRRVEAQYQAVLQERNRIAREIHDTLAQGFIGVSVQLELVTRLLDSSIDAARAQLDHARTLVRQSIADARESIWDLRSHSLENQDFASRLSKMAKQVTTNSELKTSVQVHGVYRPLSPATEDQLARIAQEALTNAVRHAGAKMASVELNYDARRIRLTVSDDGHGFDTSHVPDGHYGLRGMRERAAQIGASLRVHSGPGQGTRVEVEADAR